MASNPVSKMTEEQYLAIERTAGFRSEFLDGEMFAMAGGSNRHAKLQRNLLVELALALEGAACEPFGPDSRLRISSETYVYPDVSVVCGPQKTADVFDDYLVNPVAVFEVLSPSTEKYDRGTKFQYYRTMDSLQDYVLVSQDQVRVEQFTRQPDGTWSLRDHQGFDDELRIDSIGVAVALHRVYRGISELTRS